jgi:RNA polymerase sigma-70 factor (ECF subfamily)
MAINKDQIYIDKVIGGDLSAYTYLVDKHKDMAFSVALRIVRNYEDAEEIVQDAFVKAYQNMEAFRNKSKFSTWLYRIVFNAAVSRTRKKRLESTDLAGFVVDNYTTDEIKENVNKLDFDERKNLANKLINELPPLEYTLINLFYREECSIEEISEITGLSASNVKVKLHRIRKKLYSELQKILDKELNTIYS